MGFHPARKLYKIVFDEDSDLYGLEITAKSSTLGERRDFLKNQPDTSEHLDYIDYQAEFFVAHIADWNLEGDDGATLPITVESLYSLPDDGFELVVAAYAKRVFGQQASPDLKKESSSGDDTETTPNTEASLPMEPLP
jgi:hypothetical protein